MTTNVLVIMFPSTSVTYEAFSKLQGAEAGDSVTAASLVERDQDGRLRQVEGDDAHLGMGTAGGSLIGMLVGALGGPLGMLLGMGAGAVTGSLVDMDRGADDVAVMARLGQSIPKGSNAIIAEEHHAHNTSDAPIDSFVAQFGGTIVRVPEDEVLAELEAEQEAAEDAAEAARASLREKKKQERHEEFHERIEKLKSRFQR